MREILFRGRRIGDDKSKWFYGDLHHTEKDFKKVVEIIDWSTKPYIHKIDSSTIGQYTGLKDKDGTKIFEGDILRLNKGICFVIWNQHGTGWAVESPGSCAVDTLTKKEFEESKIIGNIHDSRNLLK